MFEKRVLRRIFGPKKEEVAGGLRRLHNEELHNLQTLPNILGQSRRKGMTCSTHKREEKCLQYFGGKP
jgi:hypothetical protein